MPDPAPEQTVLIVGAGPTGLLLGADLARRGLACRIVEESSVRLTAPRAINLHPRSLEVFADLGIAEEALALGHRVPHLNTYASREPAPGRAPRRLGRVSMTRLPSPFPFTLTLQQPATERLLEESAARYGVKVERRVRFAGLTQDDAGVTAQLEHLDEGTTEAARFGWLIGCDGISSTVRAAAGIPFEGKAYDDDLASADVELTWRYPHDEAHVFLSATGTLRCMPVPGEQRWRIVADLPPQPPGREREELTLAGYERMMRERGVDVMLHASHWMADFHIQKRIATRYREGRVLLAGDAAHVHSPSGAQGMNLGMQDAYNLGWKLARVVAGAAAPELLDTYERERRPVALRTLETTDRSVRQLGLRHPIGRVLRNTTTSVVLHVGPLQRRLAQVSAQLRTHYRSGPLAIERWPARRLPSFAPGSSGPRAGDRAPEVRFGPPTEPRSTHRLLHGTGFVGLLFANDSAAAAVELARLPDRIAHGQGSDITWYLVLRDAAAAQRLRLGDRVLVDPDGALHAGWAAPAGSLYLVRPDGYIGYRDWPADAAGLDDYLRRVLT